MGSSHERLSEFMAHTAGGQTFVELAEQNGGSPQAARMRHQSTCEKVASFMQASKTGERCPEVNRTFMAVLTGAEFNTEDLVAARDHAEHCLACKQVLKEAPRSLRDAALIFPFPLAIFAEHVSWGESLVQSIKITWSSITSKTAEVAVPVASTSGWHQIKPAATVGVALVLLAGGGTYVAGQGGEAAEKATTSRPAAQLPQRLFDPLDTKPTQRPRKPAAKPKPRAVAPVPAATPTVQAAPVPQRTDDGSSEFAPEGR